MVVILLLLFRVRWRLLPLFVILVGVTWAFGLAGYLGIPLSVVTIAGLPVMLGVGIDYAIQMHSRIEEEVVIDRAPHPIQEASVNLGPALLVVTFDADLRLPGPALRQGADDPRLRPAAGRRHRRDLRVQHRAAARHPRHPRVPLAHQGPGLQPRQPGQARRVAGRPAVQAGRAARRGQRRDLRRRDHRRGPARRSRATPRSGSTRTPRSSRTSTRSSGRPGRRPSWASSSSPTTCSATRRSRS